MSDAILWLARGMAEGVYNFLYILVSPSAWPNFADSEWLVRFIHYGASVEFLFIVLDVVVIVLVVGLWRHAVLWSAVRGIERVNNAIGRVAAWATLIMVVQQVMIVVLQRIFRVSEITVGPFGFVVTEDVSWFGEELKLYNAIIVTLCAAYTFVQGGHVRVDLFYAGASFRAKRLTDMFGALFFVLPFMTVVWYFGWYFLWRHLITPKVAATDTLDALLRKAGALKWNVETIGFSPSGFDGYFLFKILLIAFAALMFLQGVAHFYRSLLEFLEGPQSADRYLDPDTRHDHSARRPVDVVPARRTA
jgi:TRAP-type mannitol/chloroaromatic compound transport system permease small subunit